MEAANSADISEESIQNEIESRNIVVDILKQTRGVENWNGPDDWGKRFNWSEELPLSRWGGKDSKWDEKRIYVNRNGMITTLRLEKCEEYCLILLGG